jgi:pimeloyl-ACP methyl ester carboxylesterase
VQACQERSGKIIPFVGTDSTARDLDIARAAVGDAKMHYMGISYGTVLGQFYADLFPKQVDRMVLDSVANPTGWPGDPTAQAVGFENAFGVIVQTCIDEGGCPLGGSRNAVMTKFGDLIDRMKQKPLPAGKDVPPVSDEELMGMLAQATYTEAAWPAVEQALAAAFKGDGAPARALSEATAEPDGSKDGSDPEVSGSFQAILCPHMPAEERTEAAAKQAGREAVKVAPHFGDHVESQWLTCANWPVPSLPQAGRALRAEGTPTILVVANTNDGATPIAWARGVKGQLANAVLVTNDSGGHGFYPMGKCTHQVVDDYLISVAIPAGATTCHDRNPALTPQ